MGQRRHSDTTTIQRTPDHGWDTADKCWAILQLSPAQSTPQTINKCERNGVYYIISKILLHQAGG
jgi:hypothetical protein